ncbi:hypothetical protein EVAR_31176_1 [Eumeta japonica]|uniref:Uncharacterized protein n=1 Tax=Eumeta variegata TaxID=151549 RepID=A0A4C1VY77_EUMVA|nr:hypothetical protein EVAR_31176_1 [Eumeta japonica]
MGTPRNARPRISPWDDVVRRAANAPARLPPVDLEDAPGHTNRSFIEIEVFESIPTMKPDYNVSTSLQASAATPVGHKTPPPYKYRAASRGREQLIASFTFDAFKGFERYYSELFRSRVSLHDEFREGLPSTTIFEKNVSSVRRLIEENRWRLYADAIRWQLTLSGASLYLASAVKKYRETYDPNADENDVKIVQYGGRNSKTHSGG